MAKCAICEKAAHFGNGVSHSHRRSNKIWNANVKSVKVKVNGEKCPYPAGVPMLGQLYDRGALRTHGRVEKSCQQCH